MNNFSTLQQTNSVWCIPIQFVIFLIDRERDANYLVALDFLKPIWRNSTLRYATKLAKYLVLMLRAQAGTSAGLPMSF